MLFRRPISWFRWDQVPYLGGIMGRVAGLRRVGALRERLREVGRRRHALEWKDAVEVLTRSMHNAIFDTITRRG